MPVRRAIRVWFLVAGAATAFLLAGASHAHASPLKLLVPRVTSFATDGVRYAATERSRASLSNPGMSVEEAASRRMTSHRVALRSIRTQRRRNRAGL
jgi:hypothetical protein